MQTLVISRPHTIVWLTVRYSRNVTFSMLEWNLIVRNMEICINCDDSSKTCQPTSLNLAFSALCKIPVHVGSKTTLQFMKRINRLHNYKREH